VSTKISTTQTGKLKRINHEEVSIGVYEKWKVRYSKIRQKADKLRMKKAKQSTN